MGVLTDWLDGMSQDLLKLAPFCYSSSILDQGRSVWKACLEPGEVRWLKDGLENGHD